MSGNRGQLGGAGIIFVISAPSGTGKTSLCRRAIETVPGLKFSVSHTTRPARSNEREGVDYHFIDSQTFDKMVAEGKFIEWANVYGRRYGTSVEEVERSLGEGKDLLIEIDCQGARQLRDARPESVGIFIIPPSIDALRQRLAARGTESKDEIDKRLAIAGRELSDYNKFDYVVVNNDFEAAARQLESIIMAEQCKMARKRSAIEDLLDSAP